MTVFIGRRGVITLVPGSVLSGPAFAAMQLACATAASVSTDYSWRSFLIAHPTRAEQSSAPTGR